MASVCAGCQGANDEVSMGVSSFGYSGTISHAVLTSSREQEAASMHAHACSISIWHSCGGLGYLVQQRPICRKLNNRHEHRIEAKEYANKEQQRGSVENTDFFKPLVVPGHHLDQPRACKIDTVGSHKLSRLSHSLLAHTLSFGAHTHCWLSC